ncbi:MAG TPA: DUF4185 domain-containing protein [Mycobacterium sp.]|nr:DUF4185 domain-containing protein [Mycobacterium sp.]
MPDKRTKKATQPRPTRQVNDSAVVPVAKAPAKKPAKSVKKATAKAEKPVKKGSAGKAAPRAGAAQPPPKAPKQASPRAAKRPPPAPKSGISVRRPEAVVANALDALALPALPQPAPGQAINLGPIAGTGSPTGALGAGGTDLCEISPGGQVALAGDTFSGDGAFQGSWSPSMGLHVRPGTLNGNIQFDRSFGGNGTLYAEPRSPVMGSSQLPAGTVQVFGIDYALVARVANLIPTDTRLVRIDPNGPNWPTVPGSWRDASWQDGNETQISGYQAPDGWVYIVADGFARNHTLRLYRCPAANFTDRNTWHAWGMVDGGPNWGWDVAPTPLNGDLYGELSLRLIEGKAVLSGFNASTLSVEVRVADDVTQVAAPWTPRTVVATQETLPQNYGGYIVPGSTLDQAVILVSQWHTATGNPYNVQQFVVNLLR